ncbi:MAG: 4-hydroxy-tetrahydrodipicolinate reductase [Proteobacteria bacterium]|nr:4-hydroxy-tetrahydrodipicolinate reductase [Pseudomonadota bacterium]
MNISIIGYGKMGQLVEQCARERKMETVSIIDPFHPNATHKEFDESAMDKVDVCICFTQPDVAMRNIRDACRWKKQIVIGTTGWVDKMAEVEQMVAENGVGMVYSSNFSIGVNIFFKLIEQASRIIDTFDIYDILGYEAHHNRKMDSPSGTARTISNILLENIDRKKTVFEDKVDRKIEPEELHFASMRGGNIPGTHTVLFDSEFDTIELKHTARNRIGFATGSVLAAEWILDKKGLFTESDMMKQLLG